MPHSGPHFSTFWDDSVPKSSILGVPWRPAGPKMAPKICQVAPKWHPFLKDALAVLRVVPLWLPFGSLLAPFGALGIIFHDFGRISAPFFYDFGPIFYDFCNVFRNDFCSSQNGERPQRTSKNCQKPAETSTAKSHCIHWPFCKTPAATTNACTKTPSYKKGAGGARAARRIRIRRPPWSQTGGRRRVKPTCVFCRLQKPLTDPALPADPCANFAFCTSLRLKCRFLTRFLHLENS